MLYERDENAERFLAAMRATRELVAGRSPGLPLIHEDLAHLLAVLADEAERIMPAEALLPASSND